MYSKKLETSAKQSSSDPSTTQNTPTDTLSTMYAPRATAKNTTTLHQDESPQVPTPSGLTTASTPTTHVSKLAAPTITSKTSFGLHKLTKASTNVPSPIPSIAVVSLNNSSESKPQNAKQTASVQTAYATNQPATDGNNNNNNNNYNSGKKMLSTFQESNQLKSSMLSTPSSRLVQPNVSSSTRQSVERQKTTATVPVVTKEKATPIVNANADELSSSSVTSKYV